MHNRRSRVSIDWILLSVFLSIVFIGWLMLYASSYQGPGFWFELDSVVGRQTLWMIVAAISFIVFFTFNWRIWNSLAYPIFILTVLSLIAVLLFGKEIKGATSWFSVFGYTIQPSEFAKLGTSLGVAAFLSKPNLNIDNLKTILQISALVLIPTMLIFFQPDAGTAMIFLAFLFPLYRAGLNASLYLLGFSLIFIFIGSLLWSPFIMFIIILLGSFFFMILNVKKSNVPISVLILLSLFSYASYSYLSYVWLLSIVLLSGIYFFYLLFKEGKYRAIGIAASIIVTASILSFGTQWSFDNILKPHQRARINVWLKPHLSNPQGDLYNIIQSKTAIGSGGFSGKGFLNGTMTKLNYVPEQHTDFVFSILGEEQGFLGSLSLILLFMFMLFRISVIAERATFPFIRYYAYSIAGIIFIHFFINIGMTMGIMPIIGIPLPLISKGGSSLVAFSIMMAILLKMDLSRSR
ncbi:MAG: rod shape-determining protein RodA [Saprospiraceae bacterium]|nr:rod shape-determining protein RodA [Bacteroidia bacterium]NNL93793.1 rod shape-determining protein RodA [Saprospiraceae bacterium]